MLDGCAPGDAALALDAESGETVRMSAVVLRPSGNRNPVSSLWDAPGFSRGEDCHNHRH